MNIETYEIEPELDSGGNVETDEEALKLIEELKLEGQQTLVCPEGEDGKKRIPYTQMTNEEKAVYSACYPIQEAPEKYAAGLIPTRILKTIAFGRELFPEVEIWHDRDVKDPDPLLVGVMPGEQSYSPKKCFLLGRWGEALVQFSELVAKARERIRAGFVDKIAAKRAETDNFERAIDVNVERVLKGQSPRHDLY